MPLCFVLIVLEEHWSPAHWVRLIQIGKKQVVSVRQMPLHFDGTLTTTDDDTIKRNDRNNRELSGDPVMLEDQSCRWGRSQSDVLCHAYEKSPSVKTRLRSLSLKLPDDGVVLSCVHHSEPFPSC